MTRPSLLRVRVSALHSTLSSNNNEFGELESQIASKNSDSNAPEAEVELPERRIRFAEDAASLVRKHTQTKGPQLCEVEASCVVAEVAQGAAESSFQLINASESAFKQEVPQLSRGVGKLGDEVAKIRQENKCKMGDVVF